MLTRFKDAFQAVELLIEIVMKFLKFSEGGVEDGRAS